MTFNVQSINFSGNKIRSVPLVFNQAPKAMLLLLRFCSRLKWEGRDAFYQIVEIKGTS